MSKRRRRGKNNYTMSEAALEQRRKAARTPAALAQSRGAGWKHGRCAKGALAQAIPPCKRSLCPMSEESGEKGNCSVKRALAAEGKALERCPVRLAVDEEVRRKVVLAIQKGETDGLAELTGTLLAGMHMLSAQELQKLLDEGFSIPFTVMSPEGEPLEMVKTNPRAEPTLKLLDMVGATAAQQSITPKSRGEQKRDEGLGELADLLTRRAALAAGPPAAES